MMELLHNQLFNKKERIVRKMIVLYFQHQAGPSSSDTTASVNNTNTIGNTQEYLVFCMSRMNLFVGVTHIPYGAKFSPGKNFRESPENFFRGLIFTNGVAIIGHTHCALGNAHNTW